MAGEIVFVSKYRQIGNLVVQISAPADMIDQAAPANPANIESSHWVVCGSDPRTAKMEEFIKSKKR